MRITIIRPPFYKIWGGLISHPLNIGYIVASLLEEGHTVNVIDGELINITDKPAFDFDRIKKVLGLRTISEKDFLFAEKLMRNHSHELWNTLIKQVIATQPEAIGISCYTTSMTATKIIAKRLKLEEELGNIPIFGGGVHPTCLPLETLRELPGVDYIVVGEGEVTVKELMECIDAGGKDIDLIKGVGYRRSEGVYLNPPRPLVAELDSLSFPVRVFQNGHHYGTHIMLTSRGCPHNCNFCASKAIWSRKVRNRSIENVIQEIYQLKNLGIRFIRMADDTFTLSKRRVMEWCEQVEKNNLTDIAYSVGSRVDTIDEEMTERLKSVNVYNISLGIESGSSRILKLIRKNLDLRHAVEVVSMINKHGIRTHSFLMIGHPSETREDVNQTINLIKELNHFPRNVIELNVVCPYPGTELWSLAYDQGEFPNVDEYYRLSHQSKPVVNLTAMPESEFIESIDELYKMIFPHSIKHRIREGLDMMTKDPRRLIIRAKTVFK